MYTDKLFMLYFQILLKMTLSSINSYSVHTGKLTASGSITVVWNDDLKWNETNFGAVTRMHVSEDEIWFLDLQYVDESDDYHLNPSLWLHSNGTVYGIFSGRFDFCCDFDFFYYPFDQQNCSASLFDPGYDESE